MIPTTELPKSGGTLFRDRVRERDLDNFLVEELHASPDFLEWVLRKLVDRFAPPMDTVAIQKSPPREQDRRQTDVRIGWIDASGELTACVLIESKVTADFQPGQADAYRDELVALRRRLGFSRGAALLVAPQSKLPALAHDGAFDAEIGVEEIIAFLKQRRAGGLPEELDARLGARIDLLEALCGKRQGAGWIGATVEAKRDFAQCYAELAAEVFPDLRVRPSNDGPQAITRIFEGLDMPGLPRATLRHEFGSGVRWKYVNVLFAGAGDRIAAISESGLLRTTDFTAKPAGKSLALRARSPGIDPMRPFTDEREGVLAGLTAARALLAWIGFNREALAYLLTARSEEKDT